MPPSLSCVLQHWYEFKPPLETMDGDNAHRLTSIKTMNALLRKRGIGALRAAILSGVRGAQSPFEVYLPLGAGLFPDDVRIETYVRTSLHHQSQSYRIAASFAAAFYLYRSEQIACILSERVILEKGLLRQMSEAALNVGQGNLRFMLEPARRQLGAAPRKKVVTPSFSFW